MNYFPFHMGDYAAHTGHLEPMEDLAYRRLLDQYYLREGPLPADVQVTAKLVRMRSMAADVESVLNEFFTLTELGWTHSRCDAEIEKMQDKQAKARASGIASANARKSYVERARQEKPTDVEAKATDVERSLGESSTDVQLPTPTPTPTPTPKKEEGDAPRKRSAPVVETPMATVDDLVEAGFSEKVAAEFIAHKARLKAPLTDRAWRDHLAEATKAGWSALQAAEKVMAKNWKGFEAKYVASEPTPGPVGKASMSFRERDEQAARERAEEFTGRSTSRVIDITAFNPSPPLLESLP